MSSVSVAPSLVTMKQSQENFSHFNSWTKMASIDISADEAAVLYQSAQQSSCSAGTDSITSN